MAEVAFGKHTTKWITISLDEYESMKATIEVLSDNDLLKQIHESRSDYKKGQYKKLSELIED